MSKKLEAQISKISVKEKDGDGDKVGEKLIVKEKIEVGKVIEIYFQIKH